MHHINKLFLYSSFLTLASLTLVACGGSATNGQIPENTHPSEPLQIGAESWKTTNASRLTNRASLTAKIIRKREGSRANVRFVPSYLQIKVDGISQEPSHYQIHIDIDNNPATGFQFDNEAWSDKSGIDYIIEDDHLYKSTANDSSWSWKWIKPVTETQNGTSKIVNIDIKGDALRQFQPLCEQLNIGYIELDSTWNISDFYPKATSPLKQTISFCSHNYNTPPKLTLNGTKNMVVEINDPSYSDPGANAYDDQDGDISADIKVSSDVNIRKVGSYTVNYEVTDSQGLTASATRNINVVNPSQDGIKIDGKKNDWATINPLVQERIVTRSGNFTTTKNYLLNVTDDHTNLYFYADASTYFSSGQGGPQIENHWQIFIDADNNSATGYEGHFEYLIEDGDLFEFYGSSPYQWAWKPLGTRINLARGFSSRFPNRGSVELAVNKNALPKITGNTINVRFTALHNDWTDALSMPLNNQVHIAYVVKHKTSQKADFNKDGVVNAADYVLFKKYFKNKDLKGDLNGDGIISFADLDLFRIAYLGTRQADLNGDGEITIQDVNLFKVYFNDNDLRGDFNKDGQVSFADLNVFKTIFAKEKSDYNNDGSVNSADYILFKKYYADKDSKADLNADGIISFADLALFREASSS